MRRLSLLGWFAVSLLGIVVLAGVFALGVYSAPTKTIEKVKVVEVQKETTVVQQKVDLEELKRVVADLQRRNNVVRERTVVVQPDGTRTETEKEVDKTETSSRTETTTNTSASSSTETKVWKETVRVEEKVKLVERLAAPDTWALGVQAGISLPALVGSDVPGFVPGLPDAVVVGVSVDRRVVGPVWGGAWANSQAAAGVQLRLVW